MDSKSKGVLALVLSLVILANIGIFYKMHANKDVSNADVIVVRIGHTTAENNPIHEALAQFEKELEESSNGRIGWVCNTVLYPFPEAINLLCMERCDGNSDVGLTGQ